MKFYLFAQEPVKSAADLPAAKAKAKATLDGLKALMEADAKRRAEG
jgi:phosphoglucomutase